METLRYHATILLLISMPAVLVLWVFIHLLAPAWRRIGPLWTYLAIGVPMLALAGGLYRVRGLLVGGDFGANPWLLLAGGLAGVGCLAVRAQRKQHLTVPMLLGVPELSPKHYPGTLLQDGIYARTRNPRYIEALLGVLGAVLWLNYLTAYLLFLFALLMIYLIVILEERELRQRFGADFEAYCCRVPRFVPGFGSGR